MKNRRKENNKNHKTFINKKIFITLVAGQTDEVKDKVDCILHAVVYSHFLLNKTNGWTDGHTKLII